MPQVVKVRKETVKNSKGEPHEHIVGVIDADRNYYTNQEVVNGINVGLDWYTSAEGKRARIREMKFCPAPQCMHQPYITTDPYSTTANNLENLPRG